MKVILNASKQPYINLGVQYGGIKINGIQYIYNPVRDAFIDKKFTKFMRAKTWEQFLEFIKNLDQ
jgi:hypothetical protein